MQTKLTREDAIALLRKHNKEPFHILHGLTVGGVLNGTRMNLDTGMKPDSGRSAESFMILILRNTRKNTV